ncbi:unnamed protein product [Mycetohabitans rhizoxinica HKI 454]|uniref:Uncharacterized protein n=1 Tax=Mycetohabitans rhizoxinica (strain DSM 19002 / CIP 109453 / HKI 454) TaxID=882378 RepID=E5ARL2_MYCRK|nr:unnamed protein product [Mycetohabitans rhizoxinica HKI 454]
MIGVHRRGSLCVWPFSHLGTAGRLQEVDFEPLHMTKSDQTDT